MASPTAARPHVLLLLSDQLNLWGISAYNRTPHPAARDPPLTPAHSTPHIDTLVRGGAIFTNYMASYATCTPSRHALLTSIHPDRLHREEHWLNPQTTQRSLGYAFQSAGYATFWVGKWHITGDYDDATAEGLPITKGLGTMPRGTAGFLHTRYMFHRTSHPKTAVDIDELGCAGPSDVWLNASDPDSKCPPPIFKLDQRGGGSSCLTERVAWQNPTSGGVLLSNDVPCTDAHLHYSTNAIFRWAWHSLQAHFAHNGGATSAAAASGRTAASGEDRKTGGADSFGRSLQGRRGGGGLRWRGAPEAESGAPSAPPAFLVISIPDPHPSEGGYVVRSPYNRLFRNSSSSASGGGDASALAPVSYWDATPVVTTDVKPFATRQREIVGERWKAQHLNRVLRLRQAFAGMVKVIDDCVGELLAKLQAGEWI